MLGTKKGQQMRRQQSGYLHSINGFNKGSIVCNKKNVTCHLTKSLVSPPAEKVVGTIILWCVFPFPSDSAVRMGREY